MLDITVAWDKLSNFETADEIAQFLMDQGIKANKRQIRSCAISKWMREITGDFSLVTNQFGIGKSQRTRDGGETISKIFDHTVATEEFMNKFDTECYPELVYWNAC